MTNTFAPRRRARGLAALAALALLGTAGCNDFLSGGELDNDPNRPPEATNRQLFVGVQTNLWSQLASDPSRVVNLWTQQFEGIQSQYYSTYIYQVNENTTNGFHRSIYAGGGLRDVRDLQNRAREEGDTLFLGIAQVQEAMLMGMGASLFGDLVYSEALTGEPDPALDEQLAIYDAVQALLSAAITNLQGFSTAATNLGPGSTDLNYSGDPDRWTRLAYSLKARFHLHTAEVRGAAAYEAAYAAAQQGILDPADDWKAVFSGSAGEENFWFQFTAVQRFGYLAGHPQFVALLQSRNDPRLDFYFDVTGDLCGDPFFCLGGTASGDAQPIDPGYDQPLVTAAETRLILAEAAHRTNRPAEAQSNLTAARALAGLDPIAAGGPELLREILTEKYIAMFQNIEAYNDYKRTCFPNLVPTVEGLKIPARFPYDTQERLTNSNIPGLGEQPTRNDNDPPNATDPFGNACLGQ